MLGYIALTLGAVLMGLMILTIVKSVNSLTQG